MTQEQKAKAYDEALERASISYKDGDKQVKTTLESIFPEFRESEDEKIREWLVEHQQAWLHDQESGRYMDNKNLIKSIKKSIEWLEKQGGITKLSEEEQNRLGKGVLSNCAMSFINYLDAHKYEGKMCVSNGECEDIENAFHNAMWDRLHRYYCKYIEKQSEQETACDKCRKAQPSQSCQDITELGRCYAEHEQKPTNNAEPKFNVGDWVIDKQDIVHQIANVVEIVTNHTYGYDIVGGGYFNDNTEGVRLWTIQDAKEGDVLAEDSCIFIIQKLGDNGSAAKTYCSLYSDGDFDDGTILYFDVDSTNPATKEQRDLLFQKMKEAGYEWVTEKRELGKIEHEPTDKADPKFHEGEWITNGERTWFVEGVHNGFYDIISPEGCETDDTIRHVDEHFHLWTIQDAKGGDILAYNDGHGNDCIELIKSITDKKIEFWFCLTNGNDYEVFGGITPYTNFASREKATPATKEQRDLLSQKMEEAGYEWDADKKELNYRMYIDLGLPSGTLWAAENEEGGFYTYEQAMIRFGDNLPSKERFEELKSVCRWTWNGSGYIVAGPNGNNIVLPAAGYRDGDGNADYVGMLGSLWSSTPDDSDDALFLYFDSGSVDMAYSNRCYFRPIRLVKKKDNNMKNKKLNLVEILKDCPKGTELYTPMFGKVRLRKVNAKDDDMPISVELQDKGTRAFTSDGRYSIEPGGECVLFPSKDNRDWESFHVCPNFKKGDFVARVHDGKSTILLMGDTNWNSPYSDVKYICYLNLSNDRFRVSQSIIDYWCTIKEFYEQDGFSLATDDEKKKLLDAIEKHGYVWNEEKLELKKKEHVFKPFDKVLVRDFYDDTWTINFFSHKNTEDSAYPYSCIVHSYQQCIPYEGNEHLVGTTQKP